ncbi:MAG: hypothetical protein SPJ13_00090 [Bacteroidales bacterium]|nr:hypothetical protein [Bacteroidales bacterium]
MKKEYRILMIARESDTMSAFSAQCKRYHIFITLCATIEKAYYNVTRFPWRYDAILLTDAANYPSDLYTDTPINLQELTNAIEASHKPYFVFAPEHSDIASSFDRRHYVPGMDNDDLIDALIAAIDRMPRHLLRSDAFSDVFTSLEFIGTNMEEAEPLMMRLLAGIFCPDTEDPFDIPSYYQWQRLLVGCVMEGCHAVGLLPEECFSKEVETNIFDCHNYMGGRNTRYAGVRFGIERKDKKGRDISDRILSTTSDHLLGALLHVGDVHSSTTLLSDEDYAKLSVYFQNNNCRYLLYGYTLQLCNLVNELAAYVLTHPNKEDNLGMRRPLGARNDSNAPAHSSSGAKNRAAKPTANQQPPLPHEEPIGKPNESHIPVSASEAHISSLPPEIAAKYEGKVFLAEQDGNTWHCGECLVVGRYGFKGKWLRLKNVRKNDNPNTKYPYFAHFEIVKPEENGET